MLRQIKVRRVSFGVAHDENMGEKEEMLSRKIFMRSFNIMCDKAALLEVYSSC